MCDCDSERPEISTSQAVKAKKYYACSECQSEISPGEKYELSKWLYEGKWYQSKTCLPCLAVSRLFQQDYDCCAAVGELYQELIDCDVIGVSGEGGDRLYHSIDKNLYVMTQNPLRIMLTPSNSL